jgi:hypothetical protein
MLMQNLASSQLQSQRQQQQQQQQQQYTKGAAETHDDHMVLQKCLVVVAPGTYAIGSDRSCQHHQQRRVQMMSRKTLILTTHGVPTHNCEIMASHLRMSRVIGELASVVTEGVDDDWYSNILTLP